MLRVACSVAAIAAIGGNLLAQSSDSVPLPVPQGTSPAASASVETFAAQGFIINSTHPWRFADERRIEIALALTIDHRTGEARLTVTNPARPNAPAGTYFWRRGRLFEIDNNGQEVAPTPMGDVPAATIALIHPALLDAAIRELPECVVQIETTAPNAANCAVAIAGALWRLHADPAGRTLSRRAHDQIRGSLIETIEFGPNEVTVRRGDRTIAQFQLSEPVPAEPLALPAGDAARDAEIILAPEEVAFIDKGGGLYACDLARLNSRVFIIEFSDALMVFEGSFSSRNAQTIADAIQSRFHKPVKWFAFSHIHPQYIAGVRTWAAQGATILVPPDAARAVEQILAAPFDLRPDAWSRATLKPNIETFTDRWTHSDASAEVVLLNNLNSKHTDEYTLVYLPRTKTLLSGDLIFYRPGKPLGSRAEAVLNFMQSESLAPDRFLATWPLAWDGTESEGSWHALVSSKNAPSP